LPLYHAAKHFAVEDSLSEADDEMDRALKQAEMNYETLGKDYLKKIQKQRLGASVIKIDKSNPLDVLKYLQHGYDSFAVDTCMIGFTEITSPIIKWENILGFGNPQSTIGSGRGKEGVAENPPKLLEGC